MQIETEVFDYYTVVSVIGRLDAAWADHFLEVNRDLIRTGRHDLRVDASELEYLSSAGIRALLKMRREVESINGSFGVIRASAFVRDTLRLSGMEALLLPEHITESVEVPAAVIREPDPLSTVPGMRFEHHALKSSEPITVKIHSGWFPWQLLEPDSSVEVDFSRPVFGLGIGASGRDAQDASNRYGDFAAAGGYVSWLAGDGMDKPDYLEQAEQFAPRLHAIQAIVGKGEFTDLLRFRPDVKDTCLDLSTLYDQVLLTTRSDTAVMIAMVEVDGLVGATLARSPALIKDTDRPGEFPEIRDWLAFCGERVHRRTQALVVAVLSRDREHVINKLLSPLPSNHGISAHAHAVVFPFSALPQGVLDLDQSVSTVYENSAPIALMHLIEDDRPAIGIGQSSFIQGACWCAPINYSTETLSCH